MSAMSSRDKGTGARDCPVVTNYVLEELKVCYEGQKSYGATCTSYTLFANCPSAVHRIKRRVGIIGVGIQPLLANLNLKREANAAISVNSAIHFTSALTSAEKVRSVPINYMSCLRLQQASTFRFA